MSGKKNNRYPKNDTNLDSSSSSKSNNNSLNSSGETKDRLLHITKKYQVLITTKILAHLIDIGFSKEEADEAIKFIVVSTRSEMIEKFKDSTLPEMSDSKIFYENNTKITSLKSDYPEFVSWATKALVVPFYHSIGDTVGYNNGKWEFNYGNINAKPEYTIEMISEFISMGGILDMSIKNWRASDDTILYMATMNVLAELIEENEIDIKEFGLRLRTAYIATIPLIKNRDPGNTTINSLEMQQSIEWDKLPYNSNAKGNGAVMRAGCIGIFFPGHFIGRRQLIKLAVECSRITHNSAISILGSVAAALFTALALEKKNIETWPHKLLKLLRTTFIDDYVKETRPNDYPFYQRDKPLFVGQFEEYVRFRFYGDKADLSIKHMKNPVLRYKYLSENFSKNCDWPGGCADDCIIMAYDALLESQGSFEKIIIYSAIHPGDSDTVGAVALGWFGAYYHSRRFELFFEDYFDELEFRQEFKNFLDANVTKMIPIYWLNIYRTMADQYMNNVIAKHNRT